MPDWGSLNVEGGVPAVICVAGEGVVALIDGVAQVGGRPSLTAIHVRQLAGQEIAGVAAVHAGDLHASDELVGDPGAGVGVGRWRGKRGGAISPAPVADPPPSCAGTAHLVSGWRYAQQQASSFKRSLCVKLHSDAMPEFVNAPGQMEVTAPAFLVNVALE